MNYYQLLEVEQDSSAEELKKKYKKLARKYHPDNKETGDEEMFKQIGQAYSVLSDPQKKRVYDQVGHEAFVNNSAGGSQYAASPFEEGGLFGDLEDVLNMFGASFSQGSRGSRGRKRSVNGSDLQVLLEIDLLEAAFGAEKELEFTRQKTCPDCQGTGADPAVPLETCTVCHGTGEIRKTTRSFLGMVTQVQTCYNCNGVGKISKSFCKTCKGKKQLKHKEKLKVRIPKGIEEGTRLFWEAKGNEGLSGGRDGDLYILVKVKKHPKFTRQKLDIWTEEPINLFQAIKGDKIKVETIHGEELVTVKPGTQSGTILTLKNKGISSGSHNIEIKVKVPSEKELSGDLLARLGKELNKELNQEKKKQQDKSNSFFGL